MSRENVDLLVRAYEAWNRRDFDALLLLVQPGVVLVQDPAIPGAETVEGRDELQRWLRAFSDTWEEFSLTPEKVADSEDEVAVVVRVEAKGRGSGVELDARVGHLMTVEGGKVSGLRTFNDAEQVFAALRSAG
jgi:ketosteroid isomerase-like protein